MTKNRVWKCPCGGNAVWHYAWAMYRCEECKAVFDRATVSEVDQTIAEGYHDRICLHCGVRLDLNPQYKLRPWEHHILYCHWCNRAFVSSFLEVLAHKAGQRPNHAWISRSQYLEGCK